MDPTKLSRMERPEYDALIEGGYICRIAFKGENYPYIAPFLYVFDGRCMYFLFTKYGRKVKHFEQDPHVAVEVEVYSPDLSYFAFVVIPGRLVEVEDLEVKRAVRQMFMELIRKRNLSSHVLSALGYPPGEPVEALLIEERNSIWKLVGVNIEEITGLKSPDKE